MKCAKCNIELEVLNIKGITVLYCKDCKGMWIKYSELKKIGETLGIKNELINPADMQALSVKEEQRQCPSCTKTMDKVYFNGVIVDKCSACNGTWFDNGELSKYFKTYMKNAVEITDNITFLTKYCNTAKISTPVLPDLEIQSKEQEFPAFSLNGFLVIAIQLLLFVLLYLTWLVLPIPGVAVIMFIILAFITAGYRTLKPQEALALTVFGKYVGTLRGAGFHWVNPFSMSATQFSTISLKAMTLDNGKQKINDELGNPIEVGIIVIWEVADTAKAIFNVDDYKTFISAQSDSALRNIVRMYPYDASEESGKSSLRGDSAEISAKLKAEIQRNVKVAGINIVDAKITHLAYAPEIAIAMLQRQQAVAVIDAKKTIVEGAVGMVEMALNKLATNNVAQFNAAEKAQMINNLLVVLCSNKEAQPVIKNNL
ncbi:MAG: SPFH domain-containing protein [Candidatus Gastranaerophilaceae bacterium]